MFPNAEVLTCVVPLATTPAEAVFLVETSVNGNSLEAPAVKVPSAGAAEVEGVISIFAPEKYMSIAAEPAITTSATNTIRYGNRLLGGRGTGRPPGGGGGGGAGGPAPRAGAGTSSQ